MITIDQLLESVDLDFEPRWVTKDLGKHIEFWSEKPKQGAASWRFDTEGTILCSFDGRIKLAEFENKPWTECIYEVPRKTSDKIVKLDKIELSVVDRSTIRAAVELIADYLNQVIDEVNELKARMELPRLKPDLTDEDLRKMMCDPKYWRDKDFATNQKVLNGFNKLYGDKN